VSRRQEFETGQAPPGGAWDRSGPEPRWVQPHHELVQEALHSWKGWPSDMRIHMADEMAGAKQPSSGSGKRMRAQAAALLRELGANAQPNPRQLYRGSHEAPGGIQAWSESKRTANYWAKKNKGEVHVLPKGTGRGIRVSDYIRSGIDESGEREWLIHHE
jgi:hypothetical protein